MDSIEEGMQECEEATGLPYDFSPEEIGGEPLQDSEYRYDEQERQIRPV